MNMGILGPMGLNHHIRAASFEFNLFLNFSFPLRKVLNKTFFLSLVEISLQLAND